MRAPAQPFLTVTLHNLSHFAVKLPHFPTRKYRIKAGEEFTERQAAARYAKEFDLDFTGEPVRMVSGALRFEPTMDALRRGGEILLRRTK